MSQSLAEEQLIKSYFLGDLPETERERIRERFFSDEDFFEALQIVEGELVDEYAFGLTSQVEREKLESGFLISSHEWQKVNLSRTLNEFIAGNKRIHEEENTWERNLNEAYTNRNFVFSLMDDQWLGMELLLQLKAVRQATSSNLASILGRDESTLVPTLGYMGDCGLVRKLDGEYSCSKIGEEVLGKLTSII